MIVHIYIIHPMSDGGQLDSDDPLLQEHFVSASEHLRLLVGVLKNKNVNIADVRIHVPQLEWFPLFGLVDHSTAMGWCMEKLDMSDVAYHAQRNLARTDKPLLPLTEGVRQERSYCDELVWDGEQMVTRIQVFDEAEKLAQWVWDTENNTNQEG